MWTKFRGRGVWNRDQLFLRFLEEEADVIILDVMMPGTSGIDIAARIRKQSDVPIILLTARDGDEDFLRGFSAGISPAG